MVNIVVEFHRYVACHIAVLGVNYGISNTIVLEIPQFTTKTGNYDIACLA